MLQYLNAKVYLGDGSIFFLEVACLSLVRSIMFCGVVVGPTFLGDLTIVNT